MKPSVADDAVSRRSLLFDDSRPYVSSFHEFITRNPSAHGGEVYEGVGKDNGEARDDTYEHAPAYVSETS